MAKNKYISPILLVESDGAGGVTGQGTGQGAIAPEGMTYDEWWEDEAWFGENPDADYNGDGTVDKFDYEYYMENELWKG